MTDKLLQSFRDLVDLVVGVVPKLLIGIVLAVVALIVAKIVEKLLRAILVRVRFDSLIERVGIDKALQRIGIRQQLDHFVPRLVYFLLLLLFAKTAADALDLAAISNALGSLFSYLPSLVAALLLIVIGSTAGKFVGNAVTHAARESGIEFAPTLGRLVSALILFIVGTMAVTQLKFDTEIIRLVTGLLLAGAALAFGLSFGLGSRELTRNVIAGYYANRLLRVGDPIEIRGQKGTLVAITSTHTCIETESETITVANSAVLEDVTRQQKT